MAGVSNAWTQADAGVPGHPMPLVTLAGNPRVSLVFMRLPDGAPDGSGFPLYGSQGLQKLYFGIITTMTAVDGSTSYSRSDLTTTLASLIDATTPDRIDTQDFTGVYGDGDHSDHHAMAYLTRDAHRLDTTVAHTLYGYMGDALAEQPANVTGADFSAKHDAYFAYAPFDMNVCQTDATCKQDVTWAWLSAQYTTGSEAGGPGTNYPPFAVAGPNQTVPAGAPVQLEGAASYDVGGTPSFHWTQTAGPAVTLSSATAAAPTFTAPASAVTFQLTVTEGQLTSAPATMTVTPPPPNCTTYTSSATGSHQVCGAIRDKYQSLGGPSGFLGYPTTDETATPDGIGRFNHFANSGSIYWTPNTGAWSIHGAIRDKWASLGWERSFLGYPVTDETGTPDGIGRFNHFANSGSIYWTPNTGAWSIHGAIRDKWASLGWERSFLGYPVTDETGTPDGIGRFNHFSNAGSIYWTPSTGAWSIHGAIRDKWASMGWERSFLGYPVTDETGTPDGIGRFNHFSNAGSIYWTPSTGAWSIHGAIRDKWASMGWERSCLGYPVSDEFAISGGRQSNFQHGFITWNSSTGATTSSC